MTTKSAELQANPAGALASLLKAYSKTHTPDQRELLMLALAIIQVVQRANASDPTLLAAVGQVIRALGTLPLSRMDFPIMSTILSRKYSDILDAKEIPQDQRARILLESVLTFVNIIQASPAHANEATLCNTLELVVDQQPQKAVQYPQINYRTALRKIFNPGNASAVDLAPLDIIVYRGELLGGGFGPELWGLAHTKNNVAHVLLETGEYVEVPAHSLTLATAHDYDASELPPYLLACASLFLPLMFSRIYNYSVPAELQIQLTKLLKHLGNFTTDVIVETLPAGEIAACENVIDSARWRMDDKQKDGAIKTVSLGKACLQVIVTAQQAAIRPYITAVLAQADTHDVLLRLDTPREFSAQGIYLFPAADRSAALIVV